MHAEVLTDGSHSVFYVISSVLYIEQDMASESDFLWKFVCRFRLKGTRAE